MKEMKFFLEKYKKIVLLIISILTIVTVLLNTTYSLLFKNDETVVQNYSTGILEIESDLTDNSITLTNAFPMSDAIGAASEPYVFKIKNNGNVTFKYDLKLLSTSSTNQISANYIKVKVNDNEPVTLGNLIESKIASEQIIGPNSVSEISLRVWLDENIQNTEIGKTFNAKVVTEGYAIYKDAGMHVLTNLGLSVSEGTPNFSNISCSSGCGEATVGIYETEDDLGTSYYFRGDVTNNYVKFGKNSSGSDMYWRIIRINGDGTVRMIYDGTSAHANGESSADRYITSTSFNSNYNDNTYVGYMYGTAGATVYENTHSNITDSTIKIFLEGDGTIDGWYKDNIIDTGYGEYVADAIYCNDRSLSNASSSYTGIGITTSYYAAYQRNITNKSPSLKCTNSNDKFTVNTSLGNGKNKQPVGLITVDEVAYAGAVYGTDNIKYYLYIGSSFWTMSPYYFSASYANTFGVSSTGYFNNSLVNNIDYIRPVLSLKASALQYGSGTSTDPFRISY